MKRELKDCLNMESSCSSRGFTTKVLALLFIYISHARSADNSSDGMASNLPERSEAFHLYLVAIPDSTLSNFDRLRQDDDDTRRTSFAQTGEYLGQIIQGVLGGDLRPVFAGTSGFVEEPMAQQNLNSFFGTIAPALNLALREIYLRARTRLGLGTTPKPTQTATSATVPKQEATTKSHTLFEIVDGSVNAPVVKPAHLTGGANKPNKTVTPYFGQDSKTEQSVNQIPSSTSSWQYVLNQIYTETTKVPPLPLIRLRTTLPPVVIDPDDGDDDGRKFS